MTVNFIISMAGAFICLLAGYKWGKSELHKAERESYLKGREDGYKTAIQVRNDKIISIVKGEDRERQNQPNYRGGVTI